MSRTLRVTTRNAGFQQWQALLTNRTKRHRAGEFLVQGVRPISLAVEYGWDVRALIYPDQQALSAWARSAELIAVVRAPAPPRLDELPADPHLLVVVFDRPSTPGNVGTLIRSADAFGASAVVITGHAADPYDPKAVRASTGSLFALPVIGAEGPAEVLSWVAGVRAAGLPVQVVGTDEHGTVEVFEQDLTGPTVLLIGNETGGLSAGWRSAADVTVRIPITGAASSLNAAAAATVMLYEVVRQRA
jgi:TrmH family RNA methyltransferase